MEMWGNLIEKCQQVKPFMVIHVSNSGAGKGRVSGFVSPETHYYSSDILLLRLVYGLHDPGFDPGRGKKFFSSPKTSRAALGPPSLLFNEYQRYFPEVRRPGREVNNNTSIQCRSYE